VKRKEKERWEVLMIKDTSFYIFFRRYFELCHLNLQNQSLTNKLTNQTQVHPVITKLVYYFQKKKTYILHFFF